MTTDSRTSEALERLEAAIEAIQTSDDFRRYLKTAAMFHRYSFGNQLLIAAQHPGATRVAGYKTWQKLNRQVRKGERGIKIIVPFVKAVRDADSDETRRTVRFFGTGTVFDVSQTDGEPLPTLNYQHTEGETQGALFERAQVFAQARGLTVEVSDNDRGTGAYGFFDRRAALIWLKASSDLDGRTSTLLHELAHALDEKCAIDGEYAAHRGERETVAEAAAYVVAQHFGFDTSTETFTYVATWARDKATFKAALADIQKISAQMIDALTESPQETRAEDESEAAA